MLNKHQENQISCLGFCKSDDWKDFPQTSFWFCIFQMFFLFPLPHTFETKCQRTSSFWNEIWDFEFLCQSAGHTGTLEAIFIVGQLINETLVN